MKNINVNNVIKWLIAVILLLVILIMIKGAFHHFSGKHIKGHYCQKKHMKKKYGNNWINDSGVEKIKRIKNN